MAIELARRLRERLPDVAEVLARFPFAVLAAIAFTGYYLFDFHLPHDGDRGLRAYRLPLGLVAAFLWAIAAALFAEARGLDPPKKLGLMQAGLLVIVVLFAAIDRVELVPWPLMLALMLAAGLAAYTRPAAANATFWLFNHNLWIGWCISLAAVLLFVGGLLAIVETLRYLFGLAIPYRATEKIWALAGGLVGPVYALSLVPRDFEARVTEGPQSEFTSRSVAALVKFILVPMLLVYAAILHVYAVKILFEMELPKGRLGYLVLSYGTVLAATALAAWPTRHSGGPLVRVFWRIWPWLLVVPAGLLFLAVGARIRQYGLTEPRYLVVLAGLWLASLVATQGLWGERRDLRLVPGVLAVLLALAAVGPWGASGWPVRSQVAEFAARLAAAGIIRDGRVTADARPVTALLASDRQRLHGIIDYLRSRDRLRELRPLFAGIPNDPFAATEAGGPRPADSALADGIRLRLALGRNIPDNAGRVASFYGNQAGVFPVGAGQKLIGPVSLSRNASNPEATQTIATPEGAFRLSLSRGGLSLHEASANTTIRFDLGGLGAQGGPFGPSPPSAAPGLRIPFMVPAMDRPGAATLLLTNASGRRDDLDVIEITHLAGWIVLGPQP